MKKIILLLLCITLGPWGLGLAQVNTAADSNNTPVQSSATNAKSANINKREISVGPNPTGGVINITLTGFRGTRTELRILNVIGNQVHREVLNEMNDRFTRSFDFSNWNRGVYYVKLQADDFSEIKKIIVN